MYQYWKPELLNLASFGTDPFKLYGEAGGVYQYCMPQLRYAKT
jgi:hypothetical protein